MRVSTSVFFCGRAAALALILALPLGLGACQADPDEKAPQCPLARTTPDAKILTRYNGRGTDLTDLLLSAEIVDAKGSCRGMLGHNNIGATAHAEMIATRGPAAQGRDADLRYNVAVTYKGAIIDHREMTQHITFPVNVDTVHVTGQELYFNLPAKRGLGGPDYTIYFVFALTPDELAANRRTLGLK